MKTIKEALGDMHDIILNVYYDKWLYPGSYERSQHFIENIPIQDFMRLFGDWTYEGWYTTGSENGQITADVWAGATEECRYAIPSYSADLFQTYGQDFLADISAFVKDAERLLREQPDCEITSLLCNAARKLDNYSEGKLLIQSTIKADAIAVVTLTDYDPSTCINHELATVTVHIPHRQHRHMQRNSYKNRMLRIVDEIHSAVLDGYLQTDAKNSDNILIYRLAGEKSPEGWYSENILTTAGELANDDAQYQQFHAALARARMQEKIDADFREMDEEEAER